MAIISRQTGLLSAENWKKIYQTFRDADFTSYDFETLRKSMIDYIKLNYPEDFNDFTESSEFIALIDLIAFMGQSLAFRADLNARENFMDTAERRDSILKLARLISYNPKRTVSASGYLKIDSISTSETVLDSDGIDLANTFINWNDSGNENWLEQFTAVVNASLMTSQAVGKPGNRQIVGGVRTEEYGINSTTDTVPVYRFDAIVEGRTTTFEIVSATSTGKTYIYESSPDIGKPFNMLYMNDGLGNSSNGTGFFFYFKQGELRNLDFVVNDIVPNKVVNIDTNNINNSDVWLYNLATTGFSEKEWQRVPAVAGINVIYNNSDDRNLFQVNSRANDQIALVFGDGSFTNIPQGNFRIYYRVSNGLTYRITPDEMRGISISFKYVSRQNRIETLTFRVSLRYTVANASARESIDDIKQRAPQQYYTQNRMVTGEDYNILPYTNYSTIRNVKAINRTSSGLSRYLDVLDTTGKYSSTNIFGQDGVLYLDNTLDTFNFTFTNKFDIRKILRNYIIPDIIAGKETQHHYLATTVPENPVRYPVVPADMHDNETYTITFVGSTDFTKYGAASNTIGETFTAVNAGTRSYYYNVINNGTISYSFSNSSIVNNPTLTIMVGDTVNFNINSVGQPFWLKTQRVTGNTSAVSTGFITSNGVEIGTITWNTAGVAPGTYYYTSQNLTAMGGAIEVRAFGTGTVTTRMRWNQSTVGDSNVTGYFTYNTKPTPVNTAITEPTQSRYFRQGALVRFVPPVGFHFNAVNNLVPGPADRAGDSVELFASIMKIADDGTNNMQGNFVSGQGPVSINTKIPTGAIVDGVVPVYKNTLSDDLVNQIINNVASYVTFGLAYNKQSQEWQILGSSEITYNNAWLVKFDYNNITSNYTVYYRARRYVFYSPLETNFFYDETLQTYDNATNTVIRDSVKILRINNRITQANLPLDRDYVWYIHKPIVRSDGNVENKSIYLTMADTNNDSVPDFPYIFESVVSGRMLKTTIKGFKSGMSAEEYGNIINQYYLTYLGRYAEQSGLDYWVSDIIFNNQTLSDVELNIRSAAESANYRSGALLNNELVFFEGVESRYDNFRTWRLIDNRSVITNFTSTKNIIDSIRTYDVGQLFYIKNLNEFYRVELDSNKRKVLSARLNPVNELVPRYRAFIGRQNIYYQYRHNSPNTHRIDPNISNIIDVYVLTVEYDTSYRRYITDASGNISEPTPPTNTELQVSYVELEKLKSISDTMVFHSAVFKPLFGNKADSSLQAMFKVVKNPSMNLSDAEVKASVVAAINRYFDSGNWDFGETFFFSELAAYLHRELSPNIASIIIVPKDPSIDFGSLYQINAEPNEIIISAATVDDVEIISSITANQLNQNLAVINRSISI